MNSKPLRLLDPKSDVVFKKIFGQHPDLIKSFLNSVLPLPEGRLIDSVQYITPEQAPRIPEMKNTIVDVKCTDQTGRIFIVEMQMTWNKDFMKRFLFGNSKAYVQQLQSGEPYDTLCPVYGLALVNQIFDKETEEWFHHYRLTNVRDLGKALEGLEVIFLELPKFNPKSWASRRIGVLWLRFLREVGANLEEIPPEFNESPEVLKAVELAQESSYTKDELAYYDYYLDALRVEKGARKDAYEAGLEKGIEKGMEKGREEGEQMGLEKIARALLFKEMSPSDVSDLTGLALEHVLSLKKSL